MPRLPRFAAVLTLLATSSLAVAAEPTESIPTASIRDWQFFNDSGWRALLKGNYIRAEQCFKAAIEAVRPYEVHDQRLMARSYGDLARTLYHEGRFSEAEPLAQWSLEVRLAHPRVKSESLVQSFYVLAMIERAQRHFNQAEPHLKKALALQEKTLGTQHPDVAVIVDELAVVNAGQGRNAQAEELFKRALSIRKASLNAEDPDLVESLEHYALFLRQIHRDADAEPLEARVQEIHAAAAERAAQLKAIQTKTQSKGLK